MNIKKIKILLGSKGSFGKTNEDEFINLELVRTFNSIKDEKINNQFDLINQYEKERENSLKFFVYGLIESKYANCSGIEVKIKTSDNDKLYLPKIYSGSVVNNEFLIKSKTLTQGSNLSKNIYDYKKSIYSFMFELDKTDLTNWENNVKSSGGTPTTKNLLLAFDDQSLGLYDFVNVPFLFYDNFGNRIPWGTQTLEVDDLGNTIDINNDFPFFYDRHWIKNNISVSKVPRVFFPQKNNSIDVAENVIDGKIMLDVSLDFPSVYGRELVDVVIKSDRTIRNPGPDFYYTATTLSFGVGEQVKSFEVDIVNDLYFEPTETVTFELVNLVNCELLKPQNNFLDMNIVDDDQPIPINFSVSQQTFSESASTVDVTVILDKPINVPNQKVDVVYNQALSTAILGTDIVLNSSPINQDKLTLNFNVGDTGKTFSLQVIDNNVYNLSKSGMLMFSGLTQNLTIGTISPTQSLTITDSLFPLYSDYIFQNNSNLRASSYRASSVPNNSIYDWSVQQFSAGTPYTVSITNDGDAIVSGNTVFEKGDLYNRYIVSGALFSDFIISLPSNNNFDTGLKKYTKTKYIINIDANVGLVVNTTSLFSLGGTFTYDGYELNVLKDAGLSGQNQYYYISEIKNPNIVLPPTDTFYTNRSEFDYFNNNKTIRTNSLVFIPTNHDNTANGTLVSTTRTNIIGSFVNTRIDEFSNNGPTSLSLPFGFFQTGLPPYNEKYIKLNFGNLFSQHENGTIIENQIRLTNTGNGEYNVGGGHNSLDFWQNSSTAITNNIKLVIKNNGNRDILISGTTVSEGQNFELTNSIKNLNNLQLNLPTNSVYNFSANSYDYTNYIISFENILFPGGAIPPANPTTGLYQTPPYPDLITRLNLGNIMVSGDSVSIPEYYITTSYEDVLYPTSSDMTYPNFTFSPPNVRIKGVLFINSSKTTFGGAKFVHNSIPFISNIANYPIEFQSF